MPFLRASIALCLTLSPLVQPAFGWGHAGHRIVAMIAEQRLSPQARDRVHQLLLDGQYTMAQASTCPDALRAAEKKPIRAEDEYCLKIASVTPNSGPWHYIDIPVPKAEKGLDAYCPDGNCVIGKIKQFREVLKNSNDDTKRREALMYLIHFMGDIHQPLHCAERHCDQGGNLERVNMFLETGELPDRHLHQVWDEDLVTKLMQDEKLADESAVTEKLLKQIKPDRAAKWARATVDEMAWEGWELAKAHVYKDIPNYNYCDPAVKASPTPASNLTRGYEKQGEKAEHEQMMKAGVRLAELLERSLTR